MTKYRQHQTSKEWWQEAGSWPDKRCCMGYHPGSWEADCFGHFSALLYCTQNFLRWIHYYYNYIMIANISRRNWRCVILLQLWQVPGTPHPSCLFHVPLLVYMCLLFLMATVNRVLLWEHLECSPEQYFMLKTVFAQVQLSPLYSTHTDG